MRFFRFLTKFFLLLSFYLAIIFLSIRLPDYIVIIFLLPYLFFSDILTKDAYEAITDPVQIKAHVKFRVFFRFLTKDDFVFLLLLFSYFFQIIDKRRYKEITRSSTN